MTGLNAYGSEEGSGCLAYSPQMLYKVLKEEEERSFPLGEQLLFDFQPTTEVKDLTGQTD
jgi:hypothetical protein